MKKRLIFSALIAAPLALTGQTAEDVIVDNSDPGFSIQSGSWGPSSNAGFYGTNSLINFIDSGTDRVRWTPELPQPGEYRVDAWWVAAGNRAQDAKYEVSHADATVVVERDQTGNGSQWVELGVFPFLADGSEFVELTDNASIGEFISADAVRFSYLGEIEESRCPVVASDRSALTGGGCGGCGGVLLPGSLEESPFTKWTIHSDLPEKFSSEGVLYTTRPVIPPDNVGEPLPLSVREQTNTGFTAIDDDFEVFIFHISQPGDGSAPRRIVIHVQNTGPEPVTIDAEQAIVTEGVIGNIHEMESNLGRAVLAEDWERRIGTVTIPPGEGRVVAYSNNFAGFGADIDANINCFGIIRGDVEKVQEGDPDPSLEVSVVAIPRTAPSNLDSVTEQYLNVSAQEDEDVVDMTREPTGCQLSRATGVFPSFRWRNDPFTVDVARLSVNQPPFQMVNSKTQAIACPESAQTEDLVLRPGYAPLDTVGNYMVEYRVDFHIANSSEDEPRAMDLTFGKTGADIGLAWQVAIAQQPVSDEELNARPVLTGWAGPFQNTMTRSLLEEPITLPPCGSATVSVRFMVLGNSSLPFQLYTLPAEAEELASNEEMLLLF